MPEVATDVAFVLADLVADRAAFPDQAALDLHRLLGHRLASAPSGVLRYDRLRLLLGMVLEGGVVPTFDEYEARRVSERSGAPAASTLVSAYGHWLSACMAAVRFLGTPGGPVAHTHRHARFRVRYGPGDIVDAIRRFHDRFGTWPSQWEYREWGRLERQAARNSGAADPRIPALRTIAVALGTYTRALELARGLAEDRDRGLVEMPGRAPCDAASDA